MKKEANFLKLLKEPAVQVYLLGSLLSLGLVVMIELSRGLPELVLLSPVLLAFGLLGMFARFGTAPFLVLLTVGIGELWTHNAQGGAELLSRYRAGLILEVFLCLAVASYLICQFRLHALTLNLFPRDPRRRREPEPDKPVPYYRRRRLVQRRVPGTFAPWELVAALIPVPLCMSVTLLVWPWLVVPPEMYGLPAWAARLVLVFWCIFALSSLAGGVLTYWRWRSWSAEQAQLVLQDIYWRETRREQRRQYRWLAWARRFGKYRKGQS